MNIARNAEAPAGHNRQRLSGNQNQINAGGIEKSFDASNNTENTKKLQCQKCNPSFYKIKGAMKLCANCEAESDQTKNTFLDNFRRHRKIVKLNCFCFACSTPKSLVMMSKIFPICRTCADELKTKGATAQSNFIDRATNNFFKNLKRAVRI